MRPRNVENQRREYAFGFGTREERSVGELSTRPRAPYLALGLDAVVSGLGIVSGLGLVRLSRRARLSRLTGLSRLKRLSRLTRLSCLAMLSRLATIPARAMLSRLATTARATLSRRLALSAASESMRTALGASNESRTVVSRTMATGARRRLGGGVGALSVAAGCAADNCVLGAGCVGRAGAAAAGAGDDTPTDAVLPAAESTTV